MKLPFRRTRGQKRRFSDDFEASERRNQSKEDLQRRLAEVSHKRRRNEPGSWCRNCETKDTSRWQAGPDGHRTLCTPCSSRYKNKDILLFGDKEGKVSLQPGSGRHPVVVTGWGGCGSGPRAGQRDLTKPLVRSLRPDESVVKRDRHMDVAHEEENREESSFLKRAAHAGHDNTQGPKRPEIRKRIQPKRCCKCDRTGISGWGTGPDGHKSLCSTCHNLYVTKRMVLFQDKEGRVSATSKPEMRLVIVMDWDRRPADGMRILCAPRVRPLSLRHHRGNLLLGRDISPRMLEYIPPAGASSGSGSPPSNGAVISTRAPVNASPRRTNPTSRSLQHATSASPVGLYESKSVFAIDSHRDRTEVREAGVNAIREWEERAIGPGSGIPVEKFTFEKQQVSMKASHKSKGVLFVRRFGIQPGLSWESFRDQVCKIFNVSDALDMTYVDEAGDIVTVSSDVEMEMMFAIARIHSISPIRIRMTANTEKRR